LMQIGKMLAIFTCVPPNGFCDLPVPRCGPEPQSARKYN
jgi:hypothetical protein